MASKAKRKPRVTRRPRRTAEVRDKILSAMNRKGLNILRVAELAGVPRTVAYDFLGGANRDIKLSHAELIWRAVGLDVAKMPGKGSAAA